MKINYKAWFALLLISIPVAFYFGHGMGKKDGTQPMAEKAGTNSHSKSEFTSYLIREQELKAFIAQQRYYEEDIEGSRQTVESLFHEINLGDFDRLWSGAVISKYDSSQFAVIYSQLVSLKKKSGGFMIWKGGLDIKDTLIHNVVTIYLGGFLAGNDTFYVPVLVEQVANETEFFQTTSELYIKMTREPGRLKVFLACYSTAVGMRSTLPGDSWMFPLLGLPYRDGFGYDYLNFSITSGEEGVSIDEPSTRTAPISMDYYLGLDKLYPDENFNGICWDDHWKDAELNLDFWKALAEKK